VDTTNHIEDFFARYPGFDYNAGRGSTTEFQRLCRHFGWPKDSDDRNDAKDDFKNALVKEFNSIYGTDENDLGSWQGLCGILGIPISESLEECRKVCV
jgi:hypothetical protein